MSFLRVLPHGGRFAEAVNLHEQTLTFTREEQGEQHPNTLIAMDRLAVAYGWVGRLAEADHRQPVRR